MSGLPIIQPGEAGESLAGELERFSFGVAVSSIAEVIPIEGPDAFVKTVVSLGGISLIHSQHPRSMQQNMSVSGEAVPPRIVDVPFIFDTRSRLLMAWFEGNAGPMPVPEDITTELSSSIKTLNDSFEQQS